MSTALSWAEALPAPEGPVSRPPPAPRPRLCWRRLSGSALGPLTCRDSWLGGSLSGGRCIPSTVWQPKAEELLPGCRWCIHPYLWSYWMMLGAPTGSHSGPVSLLIVLGVVLIPCCYLLIVWWRNWR